ncbi:hypothetical protein [Clostridium brassicae]|uniref:DUF3784 domain-containing protein n=1 Tax=Clostridium brassicae TaxID=2999072 RepID=A0ABT4DBP4_9CLOT|nr:hypothetical protein [Clostridium brassicae]MCY6958656.1 hypothetical protein [Clostridium brassicae]
MSLTILIVTFTVTYIVSSIIFTALNKSNLQLFVPIQRLIKESGKEKIIRRFSWFVMLVLFSVVFGITGVNVYVVIILSIGYGCIDTILREQ